MARYFRVSGGHDRRRADIGHHRHHDRLPNMTLDNRRG